MELSSIAQKLLQTSQKASVESLVKLLETGAIKTSTPLTALVGKVEQLSSEQRQALSAHWLKSPTTKTPEKQQNADTLHGKLRTLLEKPQLLSAELKLLNITQRVITDQPLISGQKVPISIRPDLQLQLLEKAPIQSNQNTAPATNTTTIKNGTTNVVLPNTESLISKQKTTNTDLTNKQINTQTIQPTQIRQHLRETIPFEKSIASVINTLTQLKTSTETLAPHIKNLIAEPKTWALINQLTHIAKTPKQLSNPPLLKNAIQYSGAFENKTLANPTPAKNKNELAGTSQTNITQNIQQDLKIALASLESQIQVGTPLKISHTPKTSFNAQALLNALSQLQGISMRNPKTRDLTTTIRQQVSAQVQGGLAKLNSLQLQQLLQQHLDPNLTNQGAIIEIPVRVSPENIVPLMLHLQEKWFISNDEEKNKDKNKNAQSKLKKYWRVFMELDLEKDGWLATEIKVTDSDVKTVMWAEQDAIREKARKRLGLLREKLEANGIQVSEISVASGAPSNPKTSLDYGLVDITT